MHGMVRIESSFPSFFLHRHTTYFPLNDNQVIRKSKCCLRGEKQVVHRYVYSHNLYALVLRNEIIRMFLDTFSTQGLILEGVDVYNAYFYGDIDVPIIMDEPIDSYVNPHQPRHVCQLNKPIYDTRQVGEIGGSLIRSKFLSCSFNRLTEYMPLYFIFVGINFFLLIVVVDYMGFASNSQPLIDPLKKHLSENFKVKLLGQLKAFVEWDIRHYLTGFYVNQSDYI